MIQLDSELRDSRRTAHEIVRDTLRQAILRGSLPGGTRLVQADIAKQLTVSTTPVREALRDLATEGLIRLDPHRGAIVEQLTYEEIREIHDLCKLLEPEAMLRAASHVSNEQVARCLSLIELMEHEDDVGKWTDYNRQFHATLAERIPSPRLIAILNRLRDSAAPYVGLSLTAQEHRSEANADHREMIEVLRSGDGKRLAEIAERHLDLTIAALEEARELFEVAPPSEPQASTR